MSGGAVPFPISGGAVPLGISPSGNAGGPSVSLKRVGSESSAKLVGITIIKTKIASKIEIKNFLFINFFKPPYFFIIAFKI